jgi:hypothetical protein
MAKERPIVSTMAEEKKEVKKITFYFSDPACSIEAETQEEAVKIFNENFKK